MSVRLSRRRLAPVVLLALPVASCRRAAATTGV